MSQSKLVNAQDLHKAYGVPYNKIKKILADAGVNPVYESGAGINTVRLFSHDEAQPALMKWLDANKPKPATQPEPTFPTDTLSAQIRAVFGNTEILRQRLEDLSNEVGNLDSSQGNCFEVVEHKLGTTQSEIIKAVLNHAGNLNAKLNVIDERVANVYAGLSNILDAFERSVDARLDRLTMLVETLLARTPQESPAPAIPDGPTIKAHFNPPEPAFVEPKPKPKRVVVYGLNNPQVATVKKEVGDAYDLSFFQGADSKTSRFETTLAGSEFLICLSSFAGNGPEQLCKKAGVPCVRAQGGTTGLVRELIERL